MGGLETRIDGLETRMGGLENGQRALWEGISGLESRVNESLDGLRVEVTSFCANMGARIDRVQDTATMIRDDIRVNYAATDNVRSLNHNTREDVHHLAEQVSGIYVRVKQLEEQVRDLKGDP